jgi:hypothetical protein
MKTHWVEIVRGIWICTSCIKDCRISTLREPHNGYNCDGTTIAVDLMLLREDQKKDQDTRGCA